jgi:hypothetical protein
MNTSEMNKGVQIILERMKSNPEEFTHNNPSLIETNKWADILIGIRHRMTKMAGHSTEEGLYSMQELSYLTDEEVIAMDTALKGVRRDDFTKRVMGKLLDDADDGNYHASAQSRGETPKKVSVSKEELKLIHDYMLRHKVGVKK